jgi:hypothetical protein
MAVVTTLTANLTAKTAVFDRKMRKSQKNMRSFNATSKALTSTMLKFGAGIIAAVGIRGIARYTTATMSAIDATAKLSDRLNIATEDIIGLRHAAEIMGGSAEGMDKSLEMFVRRLGEVRQGTGEAKRALEELGLNVNKLVTLSPAKAFSMIADEINKMTNQSDKAAAAYQLFGRQGVKLINTLSLGSDGLKEMQKEAERLGLTFNRLDAAKVEEANDAIQRMKSALTGIGQTLAIKLAPTIEAVSTKLTDMVVGVRNLDSSMLRSIGSTVKFSAKLGAVLFLVPRVVKGLAAITAGLKSLAIGATVTQALGGPAFWLKLAAGVGVAAIAVNKIDKMFGNFSDKVKEFSVIGDNVGGFSSKVRAAQDEITRLRDEMEKTSGFSLMAGGVANAFQRSGGTILAASDLADQLARAEKNLADLNKQADKARKAALNAELFDKSAEAVEKFNSKLQTSVELFGKTANEKTIAKLMKMGEAITGLEKESFTNLIAKTRQLVGELKNLEKASEAVEMAARQLERLTQLADTLKEGLKTPAQKLANFGNVLATMLEKGLITLEQRTEIFRNKFNELFDNSRIKDFATSIRESLKTPLERLKDFRSLVAEARDLGELTAKQAAKALRNKARELLQQPSSAITGGESRQIRTAFVNVAALTSANLNPQVKEQQRTNFLLERVNTTLTKIELQEIG